jgi:hypothetical protein
MNQVATTQREIARLNAMAEASDSVITKLLGELVVVREAFESIRKTGFTKTFAGTNKQLEAVLASAIDAEKMTARAQTELTRLREQNAPLTNERSSMKVSTEEVEEESLTDPIAAQEQRTASMQGLTGPAAMAPLGQGPAVDRKDLDRNQNAEEIDAAPKIEEVLTAAETSQNTVGVETAVLRETISLDDFLLVPDQHVGREVVVTGSVVWLLRRYWLQSDRGHIRMLVNIDRLPSDVRNKLKEAVVKLEVLAKVRARITGTVEQQRPKTYRLSASELVFVE